MNFRRRFKIFLIRKYINLKENVDLVIDEVCRKDC